ncbi:glycosyltransferase family 4 protein [Natrinema salinisoli]|uniref:glycosyltransferase family 4 protein n=1 Tax=Natrinema salinisoli TaxID=2878535 RepID=UPI001CF0933D|nr:glycosyltransferase family 4 protein [Natrinema salinisoli]
MPRGKQTDTKLTLVSQFFYPDTSANANVLSELAVGLEERGFDVSVVTGQPAYAPNDRRDDQPRREMYKGVAVRRIFSTRFDKNESTVKRMANDVVFFLSAFLHLLFKRDEMGVLLLPTAPPFLPILGWMLSRVRGYEYVPVVLDLYPDMAVELDYLSEDGVVYRVWDQLNKRAYQAASLTVTIGETMEETLTEKYGPCETAVVHNWEDGSVIQPKEKANNEFSRKHDLVDPTTILYSGNHGMHHDLESVVEAAATLEDSREEDLQFQFIGEGGRKVTLVRMTKDRDLDSVSFLPYQPVEQLPESLTSGDIALVSMQEGVEGLCVSSKFYTAIASGQAILAIANEETEIARIVEEVNCGIRVDPKRPGQIVSAIEHWLDNPDEMRAMGERARSVFEERYEKEEAIDRYATVLRRVTT